MLWHTVGLRPGCQGHDNTTKGEGQERSGMAFVGARQCDNS
jgi:hypothetical protein